MKRAARRIIVVAGLALGGCVTAPPPKQSHIEASSAIRAAEEMMKAETPIPDAEVYLAKAREHVRAGETQLEQRDYSDAEIEFERAEAEAETALALARARLAEDAAKQAEARLDITPEDRTVVQLEKNDEDAKVEKKNEKKDVR